MLTLLYKTFHSRGAGVITLMLFLTTGGALAQSPDLSRRISVHYTGVTLETVLNDLSQKAGLRFSYSPELVPANSSITLNAENKSVETILKEILQQAGIQYTIVNGYLVLKAVAAERDAPTVRRSVYTISGTIADSASNELMIGAAIYARETGAGVFTNNYGFFSLSLPAGIYNLQTSFIGYEKRNVKIDLNQDLRWNIQLTASSYQLKEIIINSSDDEAMVFDSRAAQTTLNPMSVQRQSAVLGETDILKSLDNLPGISFQSDGSSYFSVRGGAHDQNLVLLDEAPIYSPSHLLGLFTPIVPEAIKHAEIYKADFPVQYGGRLSSVIDIRAREGNMRRFSGSASLGPISTRFSIEGPFKKEASSYFIAYRHSTFGALVKAASPTIESFYFSDFTSKFNFRLGQRDRLYLTVFTGKDAFIHKPGETRNGIEWGNTTGTLRWSHIYGGRLFSNTTIYGSKYDFSLYTDYDKKAKWNSNITGTTLKSEFTWYLNPDNEFRFGVSLGGFFFNPGNFSATHTSLDTMRVSEVSSGEYVLFAGHNLRVNRWLNIRYGFRWSNWSDYGEAFSIVYNENFNPVSYHTYEKGVKFYSRNFFEPRISISIRTGNASSVKLSYNRTVQNINQINNSISPLNSLEVWLPSGPNIEPSMADIYDAGIIKSWSEAQVEFTADVYYKKLYHQLGYTYHAEMILNPFLEGELRQGEGFAKGFEVMLKKTQGRFTGQISYAYTSSKLQIEDLNAGRVYPSHQDKPVDFSLSLDFMAHTRWRLNFSAFYASGMPISTPSGFYTYRGTQVPYYTRQNNDRLPDYKRIDIGSTWRLNRREKTFEHYLNISFYNLFNFRNYAFLNFNKIEGEDGKYYVPSDKTNPQELLPTYRYIYAVIPSFTYSLRF